MDGAGEPDGPGFDVEICSVECEWRCDERSGLVEGVVDIGKSGSMRRGGRFGGKSLTYTKATSSDQSR